MNNTTNSFTVAEAIKIQQDDLAKWERVLKPEVAAEMRRHAEADNDKTTNPHRIIRGSDLSNYVQNFHHGR